MKKIFVIVSIVGLIGLMAFSFQERDKKYVCLPCGNDCDGQVYNEPGSCAVCGMKRVDKTTVRFKTADFTQLCARMKANKNIVLIDVRSPEEFNNKTKDRPAFGKFKSAVNINVTELESRVHELDKYKGKEVIVYCSHSHRSPTASYFLSTHGFDNVTNVAGGVSVFKDSNGAECLKDKYVVFSAN